MASVAILDIFVEMIFQQQNDVRIRILVVDIVEKMYLKFDSSCSGSKVNFSKNGVGGHFGFGPLAKNSCIFPRDRVSHFFYKKYIEVKSIVKPC